MLVLGLVLYFVVLYYVGRLLGWALLCLLGEYDDLSLL